MPLGTVDLPELLARLANRGQVRSEATVQSDVRMLLLAAPLNLHEGQLEEIGLESPAGSGRRIDIEVGATVIEVKRDLRPGNIREEAEIQLAGYVRQRAVALGQRYVGILTDGAEWHLYHLTPAGDFAEVSTYIVRPVDPDVDGLCVWLEGVLATRQAISPLPLEIERRLGAASPAHQLDYADLTALYAAHRTEPSLVLKRELWAKLLTTAFGTGFTEADDPDAMFVEHTLLVIMAEVIAHAVVGLDPGNLDSPTLLSGRRFEQAQISGVVEEDFFDWPIEVAGGDAFVRTLARRMSRFAWGEVEHDVMKVLYESIISTQQRHRLGEYYTPDWIAEQMIATLVHDPLNERVLDPACGSGTFLFHAVRHCLAAAEKAGLGTTESIQSATAHVMGVDVHPVAVTFARVTYLLAIGMKLIRAPDRGAVTVPVYLGDSMQWGQVQDLFTKDALTVTTGPGDLFTALRFPNSLIGDAGRFDRLVAELADKATERARGSPPPPITATFHRYNVAPADQATLAQTFQTMCELHDEGRDHIWGYYVRNLARPVWLSRGDNRVDVLVGNPPWLTYNVMTPAMKAAFREASEQRELWSHARAARNHDLSGLFVARCIQLYLRDGHRFGFVMPRAVLSRRQFAGFRLGKYPAKQEPVTVSFDEPWDLDQVRPHPFPVPSAVIFGKRTPYNTDRVPLPAATERWIGTLPSRNATWRVAADHLVRSAGSVAVVPSEYASPYAPQFESGAKLGPQVLVLVDVLDPGPLGLPAGHLHVRSLRTVQEKAPWNELPQIEGVIEAQFVRPFLLGSSVAPYRPLRPVHAIVPWEESSNCLLDIGDDRIDTYAGLARWWQQATDYWNEYGTRDMYTLTGRVDFQRKLSRHFPIGPQRVAYTASGSHLAAVRVTDSRTIFGHTLYWSAIRDVEEALYLVTVFNSDTLTAHVAPYQSRGQFGARHFDKYVFYVPIPAYDGSEQLHQRLASLGREAEQVAQTVSLSPRAGFHVARRRIRDAVIAAGLGQPIEDAVTELLAGS